MLLPLDSVGSRLLSGHPRLCVQVMGKPARLRLPGRLVIREKWWTEFGSFQSRAPFTISQEMAGAIAWRFPSQQSPSTHVFMSKVPLGGTLSYTVGGIDWVPSTGLTAGRDGRQEVTHMMPMSWGHQTGAGAEGHPWAPSGEIKSSAQECDRGGKGRAPDGQRVLVSGPSP